MLSGKIEISPQYQSDKDIAMPTNCIQHLLINLPPAFSTQPELRELFERLERLAQLRWSNHAALDELLPDLQWADAVLMWGAPKITEAALDQLPNLKFIGQLNTSLITASACLAKGVALSEARHCWSPAVAEMALGLILNGLRKISDYHAAMRLGTEKWVLNFPADIDAQERELSGRPVGIVGFGQIGQRLAALLQPFNVQLRVYDPFVPKPILAAYNAQPVPLMDLLAASDVVVLCAANHPDNHGMIGERQIEALRKDCVLVNIGRSMLVDMPALIRRLEHRDVVAMLDVFDLEPLEPESPLRSLHNAYLTPHRAGGLISSVQRGLEMLVSDLEAFTAGEARRNAVTEEMLHSFS
jgi:phosphoglycerate dehydrogenase-like enzyme